MFPDRKETKGLLSSEEREVLNQALPDGQFLFDPSKESISFEPFQAYLVFLSEQIDYILVMHKAMTQMVR